MFTTEEERDTCSRNIRTAFREGTVSERTAQKWVSKCVSGDGTLEGAPRREGRPTVTDDNELGQPLKRIQVKHAKSLRKAFVRISVEWETARNFFIA